MAIPNIATTGISGLNAAKIGIATTGHNIANASTEGYSRQRVSTSFNDPAKHGTTLIGTGAHVNRLERINDQYVERQIRAATRDLSHFEEKEMALRQLEDIFNEMGGDGLNRLISKFFNEFRRLAEEPESPSLRHSVKEATQALVNDFKRLRSEVEGARSHLDTRIESHLGEINSLVGEVAGLNTKIRLLEGTDSNPNDLLDKRDLALKRLSAYFDISVHGDNHNQLNVDIKGVGPIVTGQNSEKLTAERTQGDDSGAKSGWLEIRSSGSANGIITQSLSGGKLGALLEVRDQKISKVLSQLDDLAYALVESVNSIHEQGYSPTGKSGVPFFEKLDGKYRAAEFLSLSQEIKDRPQAIATALVANAPGDNRIAIAISKLQGEKLLGEADMTADEWYNSMVAEVGVAVSHNQSAMNQQKDIMTQLSKVREQISGVSIDEETTQLMQYQHVFDASAKVIQVADDMLKTILSLKRD